MSNIKVSELTKDYGNGKGIFDLNFTINEGEVFGYLGPNGAGKSTTIRHLLGFLNPDNGFCTIGKYDCRKDAEIIQKDLGYLSGEIAFFDDMTGTEFINFVAKMRNMTDFNKMQYLIDLFELDPSGKINKMSKGMKQKLSLVTAFMHDPKTLILDEPTSGLDPLMQSKFVNLIKKEKTEGKTILMSSHSFEEIEKTCDRVGIIKLGKFVADSTVADLIKTKRKTFEITFTDLNEENAFLQENFEIVSYDNLNVKVSVSGNINPLIKSLSKYNITAFDNIKLNLEEVFMGYYGGDNND